MKSNNLRKTVANSSLSKIGKFHVDDYDVLWLSDASFFIPIGKLDTSLPLTDVGLQTAYVDTGGMPIYDQLEADCRAYQAEHLCIPEGKTHGVRSTDRIPFTVTVTDEGISVTPNDDKNKHNALGAKMIHAQLVSSFEKFLADPHYRNGEFGIDAILAVETMSPEMGGNYHVMGWHHDNGSRPYNPKNFITMLYLNTELPAVSVAAEFEGDQQIEPDSSGILFRNGGIVDGTAAIQTNNRRLIWFNDRCFAHAAVRRTDVPYVRMMARLEIGDVKGRMLNQVQFTFPPKDEVDKVSDEAQAVQLDGSVVSGYGASSGSVDKIAVRALHTFAGSQAVRIPEMVYGKNAGGNPVLAGGVPKLPKPALPRGTAAARFPGAARNLLWLTRKLPK